MREIISRELLLVRCPDDRDTHLLFGVQTCLNNKSELYCYAKDALDGMLGKSRIDDYYVDADKNFVVETKDGKRHNLGKAYEKIILDDLETISGNCLKSLLIALNPTMNIKIEEICDEGRDISEYKARPNSVTKKLHITRSEHEKDMPVMNLPLGLGVNKYSILRSHGKKSDFPQIRAKVFYYRPTESHTPAAWFVRGFR